MNARWLWTAANLLGFAAAGAVFGAVQRLRSQQYYEVVMTAPEAVRIEAVNVAESLTLFGALVGIAQWLVLRRSGYSAWWIPVTAAGWFLTGAVVGAISGFAFGSISSIGPHRSAAVMVVAAAIGALVVAFLPSGAQWLVLKRRRPGAERWPLVNLAGLIAGLTTAAIVVRWALVDVVPWLTPYDFPSAKALVCVGGVTGLVYGLVTAPWTVTHLIASGRPVSHREVRVPGRSR
jgi:hypothetical protein